MLFVGDDWAEDHHDIEIVEEAGRRLARRRLPDRYDIPLISVNREKVLARAR
jgi:hypothetical protein